MRRFNTLALTALLALSIPAQAADKHALLIGINDYKAATVSDLNGAVNDIHKMSQVLRTRYGFEQSNIRTLEDAAATRTGIVSALREIARDAASDSTVYIHFSGHGSQVRDANNDETDDGMDETIVPHDGRLPGIADITDDELGAILGTLKTSNVLMVLDSCHSGTGTRSLKVRTRSVPADTRTELYTATTRDAMPQVVAVDDLNLVLMTGAANHQSALDGPIGEQYYGIFSYSLAQALNAGPASTPREIMAGVRDEFVRIQTQWGGIVLPDPQLEGKASSLDGPLFASLTSAAPAAATYLDVISEAQDRVRLLDAQRIGVALESLWGIYAIDDTDFSGLPLATATVRSMQNGDAVAELDRRVDLRSGTGARAIEILPAPTSARISLDLRASLAQRPALADALRAAIGGLDIVEPDAFARFVLEADDDEVALLAADGIVVQDRFAWSNAKDVAARVATTVLRTTASANLASLTNQASAIDLSVRLVGADPLRGVGVVSSARDGSYRIRQADEKRAAHNSLMLEIQASRDVYLTIAAVSIDGSISVLFPNTHQKATYAPNGFVQANRTLRIPDSHNDDNAAGFHWDIVPPVGHDVIQVFASTDADTAQDIRRYVAELAIETRQRSRGALGDASQSLTDLRRKLGRRGVGLVATSPAAAEPASETPAPPTDWTVRALRVEVRE